MHTPVLILPVLGFCLLASCAAPPAPAGNQAFLIQTSDFAPPKRSNPPPASKPRITRVSDSDSSGSSSRTRTTQVDGRTVIDTPPEDVEPVKTVPLEVDR